MVRFVEMATCTVCEALELVKFSRLMMKHSPSSSFNTTETPARWEQIDIRQDTL